MSKHLTITHCAVFSHGTRATKRWASQLDKADEMTEQRGKWAWGRQWKNY